MLKASRNAAFYCLIENLYSSSELIEFFLNETKLLDILLKESGVHYVHCICQLIGNSSPNELKYFVENNIVDKLYIYEGKDNKILLIDALKNLIEYQEATYLQVRETIWELYKENIEGAAELIERYEHFF